jgi:uncharacterized protein YbaP (TraB family)
MKRFLFISVLVLLGVSLLAGPMFWKAEKNGDTFYLLGSIHVAKMDFYPLPDTIEHVLTNCRTIAVEADPDNADSAELTACSSYGEGDDLSHHLSPEARQRIIDWGMKRNVPATGIDRCKTWMLAMMVETTALLEQGFNPAIGIDRHCINAVRNRRGHLVELEGMKAQFDMLDALPDSLQEAMLTSGLDQLSSTPADTKKLEKAYKSGNEKALMELLEGLNDTPATRELQKRIITDRNDRMAERITLLHTEAQPCIVVVGAAHLIGPEGVPELLRQKGYTVIRIETNR